MEMFKTDILKKEFEKFQKENFVEILKYCQRLPANLGTKNS